MTRQDSREVLIHRLERAPGRQGGRKVLVARGDANVDQATIIDAIETGMHGPGRFTATWRSNGRILLSLTAAHPPEPRQPPRARSARPAAKGNPPETAACQMLGHAQEIAALQTACAEATARAAGLEGANASLRDAAIETHRHHQDAELRGRAILEEMHRVVDKARVDLQLSRDACLDFQRRLYTAETNLSLTAGELRAMRSTNASLSADLASARGAGPDIGALLLAGAAGLAVGAAVAHLLGTDGSSPVPAGASSEPPGDAPAGTALASDASGDAASAVDHE